MSTMIFPAMAGTASVEASKASVKGLSVVKRLALAMADSRRRKAQRLLNERMAFYGPSLLEAAGLDRLSLENDDLLPLK